jgi:superfamily II DNA or RNA helicase
VDECHQIREKTKEFIKNNPHISVIGLTATPFTNGLGKIFSNVVNTVTTKQLVESGNLVPLKVFLSKEIDMEGAKKVAGEWSDKEATERGIKITGDVVTEWVKKTFEIFKAPRKTLVFAASVAHGADLADKFNQAGYNFVAVSYRDTDDYKKEVFAEFAKPDSSIHGLIAVDILTKGFDVPDVAIGISARPFSKSLSSHIQQMGRVMRGHESKQFAVWIDHSGNYLRFQDDWEIVYEEGIKALDDGKEKTKPEPSDRDKKEAKCPACGFLWGAAITCSNCGFVREKRNQIINQAGSMIEVGNINKEEILERRQFYSELLGYAKMRGYKDGWVYYKYKEKYNSEPSKMVFEPKPPSLKTLNWIQYQNIKYAKSRSKHGV